MNNSLVPQTLVNNLNFSIERMGKLQRHLQTGKRVVESSDDPAAISINAKLNMSRLGTENVRANLQSAVSFLQVQEGMLTQVGSILSRMSELHTMQSTQFATNGDRENYNKEFKELQGELQDISRAKFNGISLFSDQMPKTLFGDALDTEIIHPGTHESQSENTMNVTRWGIYRNLSQRLEGGDKTPTDFGKNPPGQLLSMVFTNESLYVKGVPNDGPNRAYLEHEKFNLPYGHDDEDKFWIEDRDDWIDYLGVNNFEGKIGVVANNSAALIPDHYSGGGIINQATKDDIARTDRMAVDFFQNNVAGGDGLVLEKDGGTQANQLANFQNAFHKLTNNGTELPDALVLNVDNSQSMDGFKQLNEGILAFKDWVGSTYPTVFIPSQTSANFQKYIDPLTSPLQNGVSISSNENGYFMGIRINEGEDYIRQGRLAIEDAATEYEALNGVPLSGTLDNEKSGVKGLLDNAYNLQDFDMSEMVAFQEKLTEALAVNGAESSRAQSELENLAGKFTNLERAQSRSDDADIAQLMTKFSAAQVKTQLQAQLIKSAEDTYIHLADLL